MSGRANDEKSIFLNALDIPSSVYREDYLNGACGDDQGLRLQVQALLDAYRGPFRLLDAASHSHETIDHDPIEKRVGETIGPYKLLEAIGEGGMGVVYMAEQERPVRRKVALKLIKPGMDSKQIIARFEVERQALALMDHPNIARVHDAGATPHGRPYFVMELVRGLPITDYCDRERLGIPERLELFVLVCRAVQHAHQKGVVHRDLKPSNVLVTVVDGGPVPKVIDFGIAKAVDQKLTDKTCFTAFAQLVGTPLYMSPEQAELAGVDVDTRSDVYSLGVLLYELLTGTTPFEPHRFQKAALDEMRRIIREEEPPRPSMRLSSFGSSLETVTTSRKSAPRRLDRAVRGELDWIVMKALEKDRRRRYETANDFAADVMRHLTNEAVEARPTTAWYRFVKYARRNRAGLTTAVLIGLAMAAGTAVSAWQAVRAKAAEIEAERRAEDTEFVVQSLINDVISAAAPDEWRGRPVRVIQLLDRAEASLPARFVGRPIAEAAFRRALAQAYADLSYNDESARQVRRAVELRVKYQGRDHPETLAAKAFQLRALCNLGASNQGNLEEAIELGRDLMDFQEERLGRNHPDRLTVACDLGTAYMLRGDYQEARDVLDPALKTRARILKDNAPETAHAMHILGRAYHGMGHLNRAEELLTRAVGLQRRNLGARHPETLLTLDSLALVMCDQGRTGRAIPLLREVVAEARVSFYGTPYFGYCAKLCSHLVEALRQHGDVKGVRELCQGWLRSLLDLPHDIDPIARSQVVAAMSDMAFWLSMLPYDYTFDLNHGLIREAAEQAAREGDDVRESHCTRLGLVYWRTCDFEAAERTIRKAIASHRGKQEFDWLALALVQRFGGPSKWEQAIASFDEALRNEDESVNRVSRLFLRHEVAIYLGFPQVFTADRLTGPREAREETRPRRAGERPHPSRSKASEQSKPRDN
jgi:serine/threonine protein kinase/Tfp pilus assembly protein PilF